MIKILQRTTDKKYLQSVDTDIWVDNIKDAFEMTYKECETAKTSLSGIFQPEQLKEIVNFNKSKQITEEEKKELLGFLKIGNIVYPLGRQHIQDDRDKNYLISNHLLSGFTATPITSKYWNDNVWWGNQGRTPQCVGYAWCHWIEDGPVTHSGSHPLVGPSVIYENAQKLDEWPGENYDGTSVRGGAKYLQSNGLISNYYWAFDVNTLITTVLNLGPVVVGTNWYYNMFFPDRSGVIRLGGYLAGGHAYVINGVDTVRKQFRIKNSWGQSWGQGGHAFISFTDMTRLIRERGEICIATELPK